MSESDQLELFIRMAIVGGLAVGLLWFALQPRVSHLFKKRMEDWVKEHYTPAKKQLDDIVPRVQELEFGARQDTMTADGIKQGFKDLRTEVQALTRKMDEFISASKEEAYREKLKAQEQAAKVDHAEEQAREAIRRVGSGLAIEGYLHDLIRGGVELVPTPRRGTRSAAKQVIEQLDGESSG